MKIKTINKFQEELQTLVDSNLLIRDLPINKAATLYNKKTLIDKEFKNGLISKELYDKILDIYSLVTNSNKSKTVKATEVKGSDDYDSRTKISFNRDSEKKILDYSFTIYIKDKQPLCGTLTREEMVLIYRLYSSYGSNITQREVSRFFTDYSLVDFKRILRAFNVTKASSPFAPHIIEETDPQTLMEMQFREKENDFLKSYEQEKVRRLENDYKNVIRENIELKESLKSFSQEFKINVPDCPIQIKASVNDSDKSIVLHLADMHIGAKIKSGSIYNDEYNTKEIYNRINNLLFNLQSFGKFKNIVINLLGDNLDGMDNQTCRRDHVLPQNMDNIEQINTYIEIIEYFVSNIVKLNLSENIKLYSVPGGNHDGTTYYVATKAIFYRLNALFPFIETTLFDTFFGYYEFKGEKYVILHGKDSEFMKRGLPLNIDEKSKVMIYEWLDSQNIYGDNIHFIKGDLHSENFNSCKKFDYRNCLSLFGASDYASYNYSRNNYGVSYDLFVNSNLTRGQFINL